MKNKSFATIVLFIFMLSTVRTAYTQDVEGHVSPETILTQSVGSENLLAPYYVTGESLVHLMQNMVDFKIPGTNIIFNRKTGQLFVRHTPSGHDRVQTILAELRKVEQRQVEIEARIIRVSATDTDNLGLDFFGADLKAVHNGKQFGTDSDFGDGIYNTNVDFPNVENAGGSNTGGQFAFAALSSKVDLQLFIDALSSHAVVNTLSAPRLVVANNQRANIKLEKVEYYIDSIAIDASSDTVAQDPSISLAQSGTILDVTPTINANNTISLELHPLFATVDLSNVQKLQFSGNFSEDFQPEVTLPVFSLQHADTTITIENGGVAVIGGLIEETDKKEFYKIPLLGDIPVIGKVLFGSDNVITEKSHVIIFVKATAKDVKKSHLR
jgi:general secretion pathway protein D